MFYVLIYHNYLYLCIFLNILEKISYTCIVVRLFSDTPASNQVSLHCSYRRDRIFESLFLALDAKCAHHL